MAKKSPKKASKVQVAFEALSIEGGLLSPEWLSKIAQLQADAQTQADYKIPKGLTLRDEIGRYWRIAEALWNEFQSKSASLANTTKVTDDFVISILKQCLGFDDLQESESVTLGERVYPVRQNAGNGKIPIVISSPHEPLDTLSTRFGEDHRKRSAFGLLQEYLNASENVLWGVVCDGETLRIVRDNASLTKPAWIEADLTRIFQEARYADFAAFWLACHRTRFGGSNQNPIDCILERWRNSCRTEGTRARDHLRVGVEEALEILGQGFISHPENADLRAILQSGSLSTHNYFQELLRVVYRIIFLVTIEERGLLHPTQTTEKIKELYDAGYSIRRLRGRSIRRNTLDRFSDLWESLKIVFKGIDIGEERLGLPALGGLFENNQTPNLMLARIENRFLLQAILKLCWHKEEAGVSRVNWRDMGPEELGSVYESLLELVPQMTDGGRKFSFAHGDETAGNARKLSGSYYTPDDLVQSLLDTALEPVINSTIKANINDPVPALLALTIIDPACGSAHFLLAAARRLAGHVARLQVGGTPSARDYRKALRQVISHCIYGVDKNPMALELARMALWLEATTPDAPLSFLDHHLICGDALLGLLDLEVLSQGIPKEAFSAQTGDEKEICKILSAENAKKLRELKTAQSESSNETLFDLNNFNLIPMLQSIENMSDETPQAIELKKIALENYLAISTNVGINIAADMYVSAFLAQKNATTKNLIPTTDDVLRALRGTLPRLEVISFVRKTVNRERVLHWKIKFSQVFSKGGFDIVLGNPPWEKINFKDEEYFAQKHPEIANAQNKARRKELLESLAHESPAAFEEYEIAKRAQDAISGFCRFSARYPLTGVSRINLYSVFCETGISLLSPRGRLGFVIASGIVTDDNNKDLLENLIKNERLVHAWDFENREAIFPGVHRSYRFCLFCAAGKEARQNLADFAFYLANVPQLSDPERHFTLTAEELLLLNPNSKTCPTFRNRSEAEITKYIYRRVPAWQLHEKTMEWPGTPKTPFNMSNDSGLFAEASQGRRTDGEINDLLPLYESKFIHQFNHRFATFTEKAEDGARGLSESELKDPERYVDSRYLLSKKKLNDRFPGKWFLAYRKITRATDERTSIATILPEVPCGDSLIIFQDLDAIGAASLCAILNSFIYDFCARQKVAGTNFNHWIWHQLPIPLKATLESACSLATGLKSKSLQEWIAKKAIELIYTANDLEKFASDLGYSGPPFAWDQERRFLLRCELDALMFHIYLPSDSDGNWQKVKLFPNEDLSALKASYATPREAIGYILDSFPIVSDREMAKMGEFRTRRVIFEIYDSMLNSIRTGIPYVSRLDSISEESVGMNIPRQQPIGKKVLR